MIVKKLKFVNERRYALQVQNKDIRKMYINSLVWILHEYACLPTVFPQKRPAGIIFFTWCLIQKSHYIDSTLLLVQLLELQALLELRVLFEGRSFLRKYDICYLLWNLHSNSIDKNYFSKIPILEAYSK